MVFGLMSVAGFAREIPMPLGVYLSWEIAVNDARRNDRTREDWLDMLFAGCAERGVDTVWIVNFQAPQLKPVLEIAARHNLELLLSPRDGKLPFSEDEMREFVADLVAAGEGSTAWAGWILSDEPTEETFPALRRYNELLRQYDPGRHTALVAMWQQASAIAGAVGPDAVAVDLYPFFGPGDPNGPHTDATSRAFFTRHAEALVASCRNTDTVPWIMPQCFVEVWGPYQYNDAGEVVALPGSYLHWRSPDTAEMRWQFFEALRVGGRGIFYFQLGSIMAANPESATRALAADFAWPEVVLKEPVNAGPAGLVTPDGRMTPQFDELGRLYRAAAPWKELITRWQPQEMPQLEAPFTGAGFFDPSDGAVYWLVLNNSLREERQLQVPGWGSETAADMLTGRVFPVDAAGNLVLNLAPGEGAILKRQ